MNMPSEFMLTTLGTVLLNYRIPDRFSSNYLYDSFGGLYVIPAKVFWVVIM